MAGADPSVERESLTGLTPPLPSAVFEIEDYTPERMAEFLLNNAVGVDGYATARDEVRALGLDPDKIPHEKPAGVE